MIRHVVLLTWTEDATAADTRAVVEGLARLPALIPELRDYRVGSDLGLAAGQNADLAVVADFDDVAGFEAYRDHPAHTAVIAERIRPILASRTAVQFEL